MPADRKTDYAPGGRPFTGRRMLAVMLGFFGVIFAVNALMAWLAVTNFRGVVVQSGYVASQDFNADRALVEAQAARGWSVEVAAPEARPVIRFADRTGAPLLGLEVAAMAMRPLDARGDRPLTLRKSGPGAFMAEERLIPGQWRIVVTAEGVGPRHATTHHLVIRASDG